MKSSDGDGDKLVEEANKLYEKSCKKKRKREERKEECCRLYERAGHVFAANENWTKAGNAFEKAGKIFQELGNQVQDAARTYSEAANCFVKIDNKKTVELYHTAIELHIQTGRKALAAKQLEKIADIEERELKNPQKALEALEKAGDLFKEENSPSTANKCYLRVAQLAVDLNELETGLKYFLEVGQYSADNSLLKYCAKEYFIKAVLCALSIDPVRARNVLEKVKEDFGESFDDTRECSFCDEVIKYVQTENIEQFRDKVKAFNQFSPMDSCMAKLIGQIEKSFDNRDSQTSMDVTGTTLTQGTASNSKSKSQTDLSNNSTHRSKSAKSGKRKRKRREKSEEQETPQFDEDDLF